MTAHPKIDPESGEMLFFGYRAKGMFTKDMSYHVVDRNGALTRSEWFEAPYSSMVHDFITTREHVLFPIFPLTGSLERAMKGQPAYAWEPDLGTHIGIMPRNGTPADMRWFEGDPCYVFHPMNAWTEGTKVFADVMKFEVAPLFPNADGTPTDPAKAQARLVRWTFDLAGNTNGYTEVPLDDAFGEFPRLDERRTGLSYRHGVIAANLARAKGDGGVMNSVVWYDHEKGARSVFTFGPADGISEPVFVPRSATAAEGDGWLLTVVYRAAENRSDLAVLDTSDVAAGPVAVAKLPHRVPYGFHGNWRPL
jgi:carotenoid cleavage dioxygenase